MLRVFENTDHCAKADWLVRHMYVDGQLMQMADYLNLSDSSLMTPARGTSSLVGNVTYH